MLCFQFPFFFDKPPFLICCCCWNGWELTVSSSTPRTTSSDTHTTLNKKNNRNRMGDISGKKGTQMLFCFWVKQKHRRMYPQLFKPRILFLFSRKQFLSSPPAAVYNPKVQESPLNIGPKHPQNDENHWILQTVLHPRNNWMGGFLSKHTLYSRFLNRTRGRIWKRITARKRRERFVPCWGMPTFSREWWPIAYVVGKT